MKPLLSMIEFVVCEPLSTGTLQETGAENECIRDGEIAGAGDGAGTQVKNGESLRRGEFDRGAVDN